MDHIQLQKKNIHIEKKMNIPMASIIVLSSTDNEACHGNILDNEESNIEPRHAAVPTTRRPLNSKFTIHQKVLGKGGFGTVKRCTSKRTKQMFAIKTIQLKGKRREKSWQLEACKQEASIHALCSGDPNVVQFIEKLEASSKVHMIIELCQGGDLRTFLNSFSCGSRTRVHLAAMAMKQVMRALCHIHSLGIVHRDIKACNILVSSSGDVITESSFKLADFGLAARFQCPRTGAMIPCTEHVGTQGYQAPEMLRGEAYYAPVDIWSSGIMLAKMLTGFSPTFLQWEKNASQDPEKDCSILDDVLDFGLEPWSKMNSCVRNLLTGMLQFDPEKRPLAIDLVNYCWIRNSGSCLHPS